MPTHPTISPIEATAKSLDALLSAIEHPPSPAAVVAFRAAIRRHGRNLLDQAGPEGLAAALARVRTEAADRTQADAREQTVREAWEGITGSQDAAA